MLKPASLLMLVLAMSSCSGPHKKSNSDPSKGSEGSGPNAPQKEPLKSDPSKRSEGSGPNVPQEESLKIAIVYSEKVQFYQNKNYEFPLSTTIKSDEDFLTFVVETLRENLTPITAPKPANFSLQLVKKLPIDQFGCIYIYDWGENIQRAGDSYKNASPIMVFDDGGTIFLDPAFHPPVTQEAKTSKEAIKRLLLNPDLVHELHNKGFKIPGEQNLYKTLHAIDPTIDTSKYPNLHM